MLIGPKTRRALTICAVIVLVYYVEQLLRAAQLHLFHIPEKQARGLLGMVFAWLLDSEWYL